VNKPGVLGGKPASQEWLPLVRPTIPDVEGLGKRITSVLESGMLTNAGTVRELEEVVGDRLGVHAVAVATCTAGLMLTYQALGISGRVVLPSFTFSASAHAVLWAGGTVDFADVEERRATLDPVGLDALLDGAAALSATHVYGSPAEVEALDALAAAADIPIVYDAAHGLGSARKGVPLGRFGAAEVFSLSPTKVVVAGEGGIVATTDAALAETIRIGRDYGNPGDYNTHFAGLNARMSEVHAAIALESLAHLDEHLVARAALVDRFEHVLGGVPGLRVIRPAAGDTSTFKDLTIVVEHDTFGIDGAMLQRALATDGIDSRRYYAPPIHQQQAYAGRWATPRPLPVTDMLAASVLSPPLWSHMSDRDIEIIATAILRIHEHAPDVWAALQPVAP
jgi:dTDP-4-amino-4,6-dideoxygalactose transaminase